MPIRRVIAKSLQCIVSFYLLIKLLCSRRGRRKTSNCGHEESGNAIEDQDALETGDAYPLPESIVAGHAHEAPRRKGVYFVSTSTIADGDTPVIIPWRTTSETYGAKFQVDPDAISEKLSSHLSHRSSYDISLCSRSVYDDSSIIGLSLLFESDEESYIDEDTTYDFFQADLQEVFLGDPGTNRIQPVDSQWNLEVAAAMNAFRSSRVDHDDIVVSIATSTGLTNETPAQAKGGSALAVTSQHQQIEDWRNDFIPEREATSSTPPSKDATISRFRFP